MLWPMKKSERISPDLLEKLLSSVEAELSEEVEEFLSSCEDKDFSYREKGVLKIKKKFGELLMQRAASIGLESPGEKKMSPLRGESPQRRKAKKETA